MLEIGKIAYEEGIAKISKKALSDVSSIRRRFYLDIFLKFSQFNLNGFNFF